MAVSSGSYTVGSSDDYATWALATADIANLTGDLTFTQRTAVTDTGGSSLTEDLGGFILKITSNASSKGDPTLGHLISVNHGSDQFNLPMAGSGTLEISNLKFKRLVSIGAVYEIKIRAWAASTTPVIKIHDILFDGNSKGGRAFYVNDNLSSNWDFRAWNCKGYGAHAYVFLTDVGGTGTIKWDNMVAYGATNTGFYCGNVAILTVTNCVAANITTSDFAFIVNAVGKNNASEDATAADANWGTGSGNVTSIVAADEFESLVNTEEDFLNIKEDAPNIKDGGTTPAISDNTAGIEGNPRPQSGGDFSIGANEYAKSGIGGHGWFRQVYEKEEFNN